MKRSVKRICSILIVASIMFTMLFNNVSSINLDDNESKITPELSSRLNELSSDDLLKVYIWIEDIDYNAIDNQVEDITGLSKIDLLQRSHEPFFIETPDTTTGERCIYRQNENIESYNELQYNIGQYIDEERNCVRHEYNLKNNRFADNYLSHSNILFISQYAPMIVCETCKSNILDLNDNDIVTGISLYSDYDCGDFGGLDISLPAINAKSAVLQGITGQYVKIGQIETGRPKNNINGLINKNIYYRGSSKTDHASLVALIMIGDNGVAPDATLYSTSAFYNSSTGTDEENYDSCLEYENIEWLLTQGVNVINRSFGTPSSTYNDFNKWVDHVVFHHHVTFIQASGKNSIYYVALQSYNAIVVGGIDDKGTLSLSDDEFHSKSSYLSSVTNKPDVVAPAVGFSSPDLYSGTLHSGTSYAAPHVTGVVAQMMCTEPSMKLRPDAIKAALMASCDRKTVSGASLNVLTDKEGAGVINAINAINSLSRVQLQQTYYTSNANSFTFNFYPLTTGTKVIVVSWLKIVAGSGANHATLSEMNLSNFDLYVYDENGVLVGSSYSSNNNVEYVRFNATTTSKYTVQVVKSVPDTTINQLTIANHR